MERGAIAAICIAALLITSVSAYILDPCWGDDGGEEFVSPAGLFKLGFAKSDSWTEYVVVEDEAISGYAASMPSLDDMYECAKDWVWVPDRLLFDMEDIWLDPCEFLFSTPLMEQNPVQGTPASDCEEQATALTSLMRAYGVASENVRTVVGKIRVDDPESDRWWVAIHCWVEYYSEGAWVALDPSPHQYWDTDAGELICQNDLPFEYYRDVKYPVLEAWAYFNDTYYYTPLSDIGEYPAFWDD